MEQMLHQRMEREEVEEKALQGRQKSERIGRQSWS
jgi:hypothetical protein